MDYEIFELGDVELLGGGRLTNAQLAYKTYGALNQSRDNVVVLPTFYTGSHGRNEGFFGPGRAIDPARHFILSINMFGNGLSTSPSNASVPCHGAGFPDVTLWDNVACQHRLLTERYGIEGIALVAGWSMAGCQAYQWAAQYPDMVKAILPFCASAKTSPHNFVFLEGVKAALCADGDWNNGNYRSPPRRGLRAFGRVYAGWAFSQTFYREGLYRQLGFQTPEELLDDWAEDHAQNWDANNLLAKLKTWQMGDISANPVYEGDLKRALGAITARAILMPCSDDLYFPPADNAIEVGQMPNAELRPFTSPWGHCVASPGNEPAFEAFLDAAVRDLMNEA
ncbi:alpha/beta fold hydrolase [Pelagibius sp. Alg239-R121]|uniref:alpha/beta fold hydrolase n=1 Tax=Pelagibius sp. Alg239-R121 TaxID=2993448 RepID=UPI0024A64F92|nr:alpha/beta fold hydrolase [Pelagibius sp. Alg239-R121]